MSPWTIQGTKTSKSHAANPIVTTAVAATAVEAPDQP